MSKFIIKLIKHYTVYLFVASILSYNIVFAADNKTNKIDDLFNLSLEDLINVQITSTSYFPETPFDVASTQR